MKFEQVLDERLQSIRETLAAKAKEYARVDDRYHNFMRAAAINRCSPEYAAWQFATKHLVSVIDLVEAADRGEDMDIDLVDEKIGDLINYLILIEGLIKR